MKHNDKRKSRKWKVKILGVATLLATIFSFSTLTAQETITTTGGDASGSGGSASYSVGQVSYQTYTGTNGSVAEGVQQPFEISMVTSVEEANGINLSISAYPNPASDYLTLEVKDYDFSNLTYQLYDIHGKLLQNEKITGNQTSIFMSNLLPATYFVKILEGNNEVKIFKVIKN